MHNRSGRYCLFIALILYPFFLEGQILLYNQLFKFPDEPDIYTTFQKQNTTWTWTAGIKQSSIRYDGWSWHLREHLSSNMLVPSRGSKQWKDEHLLNADFYKQNRLIAYGLYANSWLQSDDQVSRDNIFGNHALGIFSSIGDNKNWSLTPYLGYQQLQTRSKIDWGWETGLKGELRNYKLGDYGTHLMAESNYDFYNQLQNSENRFDINISRRFSPFTYDSLSFKFSESSKDNYASNLTDINQIKISRRELQNKLFYVLSPRNIFSLVTLLQSRSLSYISDRNILYMQNQFRFLHSGNRYNIGVNLRTHEETQNNEGTFTDAESKETVMGLHLGWMINPDNDINFEFSYVKFQYDTPDENNRDNRDEQRFIFELMYKHRFSPYLNMEWRAYTYLFHQVYIYKERSINNNWNRVLKLNPVVSYRIPGFSNSLSTEVLANYTVYDFENEVLGTRSIMFRKYVLSDSMVVRLLTGINTGGFMRLELEDKGTFYKEEFSQQVVQSYDSQLYNVFVSHQRLFYFSATLGYSYYQRDEMRHIPTVFLNRRIINQGPYLQMNYRGSDYITLTFNVNMVNLRDSYSGENSYITGSIRLRCLL
jgi:hypothetical protein